ncbi:hypothetical protein C1645_735276 [Glomus cerebriforme]|uniref:Uncharacterized protein n=1 Tax=Glomus cerebriforme TaxID=658196 RepID=A0A397T606_9GLOM|nr:hypothetical protein C1645_735276 [Glomus cerebriforme]
MDENGQKESRYSLSSARAASSLFLNEVCNKPNSRVSSTILFGLDINFLQQICETIQSQQSLHLLIINDLLVNLHHNHEKINEFQCDDNEEDVNQQDNSEVEVNDNEVDKDAY